MIPLISITHLFASSAGLMPNFCCDAREEQKTQNLKFTSPTSTLHLQIAAVIHPGGAGLLVSFISIKSPDEICSN